MKYDIVEDNIKIGNKIIYSIDIDIIDIIHSLEEENQSLKKQLEDINYTCVPNSDIKNVIDKYKNQQKEFIECLENEKDRLARECSHIYEDSLGKTRFVNEDIFNEVDTILSKYKEIIGSDINVGSIGGKE